MLEDITGDKHFAELMQKNIQDLVIHFFQREQNFGILCKIEEATFDPELPDSINSEFRPLTLFFLAGYTFETARIEGDYLLFEAGFGGDNFGSMVTVPLLSIMQIIIDESPIFINLSTYKKDPEIEEEPSSSGVKNSMESFLSNPENSKFIK